MGSSTVRNLSVSLFVLLLLTGINGRTIPSGTYQNPHPFPESKYKKTNGENEIRIGLLVPFPTEKDSLAMAAKRGAELAISEANRSGGFDGKSFKLIIRITDGLWGAGSKETVNFVYEDEVVAIITALDGRNAHLTEQVAAKTHIVQLATRATEVTLSRAFVPWFFRIVPNDKQQSEALMNEIYHKQHLHKICIIYEDTYDHIRAAETCKKLAVKEGVELMGYLSYSSFDDDISENPIIANSQAVISFGSFNNVRSLLDEMKAANDKIKIFGPLSMTADGMIGSGYSPGCEGGIFVSSKFCFTTAGQEFKKRFVDKYKHIPNPAASYAYDGVNLIIEAIRIAGLDREKIRETMAGINFPHGVTGPIQFDKQGNRNSPVFMIQMIKGHPVILHP